MTVLPAFETPVAFAVRVEQLGIMRLHDTTMRADLLAPLGHLILFPEGETRMALMEYRKIGHSRIVSIPYVLLPPEQRKVDTKYVTVASILFWSVWHIRCTWEPSDAFLRGWLEDFIGDVQRTLTKLMGEDLRELMSASDLIYPSLDHPSLLPMYFLGSKP